MAAKYPVLHGIDLERDTSHYCPQALSQNMKESESKIVWSHGQQITFPGTLLCQSQKACSNASASDHCGRSRSSPLPSHSESDRIWMSAIKHTKEFLEYLKKTDKAGKAQSAGWERDVSSNKLCTVPPAPMVDPRFFADNSPFLPDL